MTNSQVSTVEDHNVKKSVQVDYLRHEIAGIASRLGGVSQI
jgi:hypothetical protein